MLRHCFNYLLYRGEGGKNRAEKVMDVAWRSLRLELCKMFVSVRGENICKNMFCGS